MFSELYKAITAVVWELLFPVTTLILLPQTPVVNVSFDLLRTDSNLGGGRGVIREEERVPTEFIYSK
jgi:hypothetical protein